MERTTYMQKKEKAVLHWRNFWWSYRSLYHDPCRCFFSLQLSIIKVFPLRRLKWTRLQKEISASGSPEPGYLLEKAGGSLERLLAEYPDSEDLTRRISWGLPLSSGSEEKQGLYYILYQPEMRETMTQKISDQRLLPLRSIDETVQQMEPLDWL